MEEHRGPGDGREIRATRVSVKPRTLFRPMAPSLSASSVPVQTFSITPRPAHLDPDGPATQQKKPPENAGPSRRNSLLRGRPIGVKWGVFSPFYCPRLEQSSS